MLVLSVFPGIDLLGRGFESEGFCVVRGPDVLWGGDIRNFFPPSGVFTGIIGGSPCQDFSRARRSEPTGYGHAMLDEFKRIIELAGPEWFLLENVPCVPDISIDGYTIQRFDLNASECGLNQSRLRHFQFGSVDGRILIIERHKKMKKLHPACLATEGQRPDRRTWSDFCQLQGLPADFDLDLDIKRKYRFVGNGVPVNMAEVIARSVKNAVVDDSIKVCACGCGRIVTGRQKTATPACRKRLQRKRDCVALN